MLIFVRKPVGRVVDACRVGALLVAGAWGLGSGSGCVTSGSVAVPAETAAVATPMGPPQLVCSDGRQLVLASADGGGRIPLSPQPPEPLSTLALADRVLVGSGAGKIYALRGGQWQQVAQWDKAQWSELPVRAASYGKSALVWMRGNDSGTVPSALEVTAQGQVIQLEVQAAQRSQGGIWQSSYVPALRVSTQFPSGLKLLVAQVRMGGQAAKERLLHAERSPWGGRLVAPDLGAMSGDWPDAPLYYVTDAAEDAVAMTETPPVPIQYKGQPVQFRGLFGYGGAGQLYLDGRFTEAQEGVVVVDPPRRGDGKRKTPLEGVLLPGLQPPCAIVPSDWGP